MDWTRKRRIVRWCALVWAAVILLPVWYVAAFASVSWSTGAGYISGKSDDRMKHTVFAPLYWYAYGHPYRPFAKDLRTLRVWCLLEGDVPWEELEY